MLMLPFVYADRLEVDGHVFDGKTKGSSVNRMNDQLGSGSLLDSVSLIRGYG